MFQTLDIYEKDENKMRDWLYFNEEWIRIKKIVSIIANRKSKIILIKCDNHSFQRDFSSDEEFLSEYDYIMTIMGKVEDTR